MAAQDELKQIFADLDAQSDRALAGLTAVRTSAKFETLRPSAVLSLLSLGLSATGLGLLASWFNGGSVS